MADIWTFPTCDQGGLNNSSWTFNDLIKGNYFMINMGHADQGFFVESYASAAGLPIELTADAVAAGSVRYAGARSSEVARPAGLDHRIQRRRQDPCRLPVR